MKSSGDELNDDARVAWLFQANPDKFPVRATLDQYLREFTATQSTWFVGQHKSEIKAGDLVYVWRSAGKARRGSGVIARGTIQSNPAMMQPLEAERRYEHGRSTSELRVELRIEETFLEQESMLPREALKRDRAVRGMSILRNPRGSNFPLTTAEFQRITELLADRTNVGDAATESKSSRLTKLARISFNSSGWRKPTGEAKKYETPGTFNYINGFGYEDWLFRSEWVLNGWRYAFIQAFNTRGRRYRNCALDLTLYVIDPRKRRLGVAHISALEVLDPVDAKAALGAFQKSGWFDTMRKEVRVVEGKVETLKSSQWAPNVLNVRFRTENVEVFPEKISLGDGRWIMSRHRYQPYDLDPKSPSLPQVFRGRSARQGKKLGRVIHRRGSGPVQVDPVHEKIQSRLVKLLRRDFPDAQIDEDRDFVDVAVRTKSETILFEIKSDVEPLTVIRNALGQILEYAFHPLRKYETPVRLVIVGRNELETLERQYLTRLQKSFRLEYRAVPV